MFGKSIQNAKILVFSKDEFFHLIFSVILVLSLFGIADLSCYIGEYFKVILFVDAPPEIYSPDMNITTIALSYLDVVKSDAVSLLNHYTYKSIKEEMDSSWLYTIYTFSGDTVSTSGNAYKRTYALQYDSLISMFINPILLSIGLQEILLRFLVDFSIPVIFPLGLLLRILAPTRSLGNMIIAFAIGSFVFLPLLYAFNASMYYTTMSESDCAEYGSAIDDHILGGCDSDENFWNVAKMIPQAFFLPNLSLAIFITFLSAINKALRVLG